MPANVETASSAEGGNEIAFVRCTRWGHRQAGPWWTWRGTAGTNHVVHNDITSVYRLHLWSYIKSYYTKEQRPHNKGKLWQIMKTGGRELCKENAEMQNQKTTKGGSIWMVCDVNESWSLNFQCHLIESLLRRVCNWLPHLGQEKLWHLKLKLHFNSSWRRLTIVLFDHTKKSWSKAFFYYIVIETLHCEHKF